MYRHWRGAFYPAQLPVKQWYRYYAGQFDAVEINNSFYRLPAPATFAAWRKQAPAGFRYAVKAQRYLTQARKLKEPAEPLARILPPIRALGDRLGPVLYQLPPLFAVNLERLAAFIAALPRDMVHVIEFRDSSWYCDAVFALLEREGVGFCVHDMPGSKSPTIATGPLAYRRFHGGAGKYWGRYPEATLAAAGKWLRQEAARGRTGWAFFNNDAEAQAVADGQALKALIG